jgi:hypothetical protein
VSGNVVSCPGAGIVSTPGVDIIQVGAPENNPASDLNVSGVVTPRAGGGAALSVTITGANVVVGPSGHHPARANVSHMGSST